MVRMKNRRSQSWNEYPFSLGESNAPVENKSMDLFNVIDFSDTRLIPWEKLIKNKIAKHKKPDEICHAFIKLCHYIQQQPPFDYQSAEGQKIEIFIQHMSSNNEPLKLIDAALYIKQTGLKISSQIKVKFTDRLLKHPDPLALAKATITMTHFGLLDGNGDQTVANFERLMPVVELWFGNPALAEQFERIYDLYFTEDNFNDLIKMSENQSRRIESQLIANISDYLGQIEALGIGPKRSATPRTLILTEAQEAKTERQRGNLSLFDKHYLLRGNCIPRTIQQDKQDSVKTRSKTEDEQTLDDPDYTRKRSF